MQAKNLRYEFGELSKVDLPTRREYYKQIQPFCAPPGKKGLDVNVQLIPEDVEMTDDIPSTVKPGLILGRLYNSDVLVGAILYEYALETEIRRSFVCVMPRLGYLVDINKKFDETITVPGKVIHVTLMSNVDDNLNIAKAHMKTGYTVMPKFKGALVNDNVGIPMEKYIPSSTPPLTDDAVNDIINNAMRARQSIKVRMASLRTRAGRRTRRHRKRFSTRRYKKRNG